MGMVWVTSREGMTTSQLQIWTTTERVNGNPGERFPTAGLREVRPRLHPRDVNRRRFLRRTLPALAAAPALRAAGSNAGSSAFIDTNVWLGAWPVRSSWAETPAPLVAKLRRHGVTEAWVSSFDGALHTDVAGVNARLAETCARDGGGVLRPFGVINPTFPDWENDLQRCHEIHRMHGVRVLPNYHGYTLDDPRFARLVDLCGQRKLLLQVSLSIEDDRSQSPALTAAPVAAAPLAAVAEKFPATRVMVLNSGYRVLTGSAPLVQRLIAAGLWFEIATLEGVAGIESLLQKHPAMRLTFGSHAPYFYFEAALLKLQESDLTPEQLAAVRFANAKAALSP